MTPRRELRRALTLLLVVGLPSALMASIAALDLLDVFRLRRVWGALLVFGRGFGWEAGHMLGALLAFLIWAGVMLIAGGLGLLGLRALPIAAGARRELAGRERKIALVLLASFVPAYFCFLMLNYTLAMLAFSAVWLVPGLRLLLAAAAALALPARTWRPAAALALALWAALLAGVVLTLERRALTAEQVISLPRPSLGHVLMRLGLFSEAGMAPVGIVFSADGEAVVVALRGASVAAYQAGSGRRLPAAAVPPTPPFAGSGRATSPDGAVRVEVLAGSGSVQLSGDGGGWILPVHHPQKAIALALSGDGRRLATAGTDNAVRIFALPSGEHLRTLLGHSNDVVAVAFSPDGRRVASGSLDGTLRLWRLP